MTERPSTLEADAQTWDCRYARGQTPWRSAGLSPVSVRLLETYCSGRDVLEVGCGDGVDAVDLTTRQFKYTGIDLSPQAVASARRYVATTTSASTAEFCSGDFMQWEPDRHFDIVYDKGMFHGLGGTSRREAFVELVAKCLKPNGIWLSISGASDSRRTDVIHGSVFLTDLVECAEPWFEFLEVVKAPYGLADAVHDFMAWHALMRRR